MSPHPLTNFQTPKLHDKYCSPCGGTLLSCSLGLAVPFDLGVFVAPLCPNTVGFSSFNRLWALHSSDYVALISCQPLTRSSPNFAHISYTLLSTLVPTYTPIQSLILSQ